MVKKQNTGKRAYRATAVIRDGLADSGVAPDGLSKNLFQDIALIQNRARGQLFEKMAEIMIGNAFGVRDFKKQICFMTPHGKRKIDLFIGETGVAVEVKSGYGRLCKFTKEQIEKDRFILEHEPEVSQVVWMCFRGATRPLIASLKKNGIDYCDIEYDRLNGCSDEDEKNIIRI